MTNFTFRIKEVRSLPTITLCDAWLADGLRFGDELGGLETDRLLGRWPGELETDAVVQLAQAVGEPTWDTYAQTPPVAQKLAERARLAPLDVEIVRHLQHLQQVCHQPRLHLRIEEERLPVSRARRTPVRAVADLVSHPGDWEHRTLRSIQPSRVLARQIEDDCNLYENRVTAKLVDHLLTYSSKRLEELFKIRDVLFNSKDYSEEVQKTSFRRAYRIAELWSSTLESQTEEELNHTIKRLELAQRDLQSLLNSPLYKLTPKKQNIPILIKSTNIFINELHYRKVASLWRSWVKFGHKRQETAQQRSARRQREATAWDRFVLHLVVRGFVALGWSVAPNSKGWTLSKQGWLSVHLKEESMGGIRVDGTRTLRLLPLCAELAGANRDAVQAQLECLDSTNDVVIAHAGGTVALADIDRASGWSIGGRAVLFPCSPWSIDSEERMARLLGGWLCKASTPSYPVTKALRSLPNWPGKWDWLHYNGKFLIAFRAPTEREAAEIRNWANLNLRELDIQAQRAKAAKQACAVVPREAITTLLEFVDHAANVLASMDCCPICGEKGIIEIRPGQLSDSSDAMWWSTCQSCESNWGIRPCTKCRTHYMALIPKINIDIKNINSLHTYNRFDKIFGRDLWVQPCLQKPSEHLRCPTCGGCCNNSCSSCIPI